ncbi:tRNA uridine-5-carboxymethylaminomethyl(34) synthesis GTPase MnmE [Marinoscillum pacificum]|uniref:tRNA uridine-5-carboxymethylaminomethyl(34) synthesis GTPase MnmE n=1 Tax=Marinoscillum pacificum TaxID=392723 RepID=UPI0021585472|nr:tRNA uridine-5-carboxymethylaminomethyl(34) synthesis GTPase MnmE [Marinoscillum pacificum]
MNLDTIVALATPPGVGAIGVIRVSGVKTIEIVNSVFKGKDLTSVASHTIHLGTIRDGETIVDEVLISIFKGPNSYTKEDVIEISCHGSQFIIQQLIKLLLRKGARLAKPGEFTQRAFINGRFDLAQAEAVADLIASENESMHSAAMNQMRGGFSQEIKRLREELIHFASMIELELDFAEEDVEFASRDDLKQLIFKLKTLITRLTESFTLGNAIKNGIPTVIAGKPNAGKSTLLNALLNEEKAIVSDIPGTTRDVIEDVINVDGIAFRFTDTAGIRTTEDKVEAIGVERTYAKMKDASVIIYLIDMINDDLHDIETQLAYLHELEVPYLLIGNKMDQAQPELKEALAKEKALFISASQKENLENLKDALKELVSLDSFKTGNTIVTNLRHYESLVQTNDALDRVITGIDHQVTNDFVAMDIRNALHHLGELTGEITTDDLLDNIFSKFCIGK